MDIWRSSDTNNLCSFYWDTVYTGVNAFPCFVNEHSTVFIISRTFGE